MPKDIGAFNGLGVPSACPLRRCKQACICPKRDGSARLGQARDALSPTRSTFGSALRDGAALEGGGGGSTTGGGSSSNRKGGSPQRTRQGGVGGAQQLPSVLDAASTTTKGSSRAAAQRRSISKGRLQPMVTVMDRDGSERAVTPPPDGSRGLVVHPAGPRTHYPNLNGALTLNGGNPAPTSSPPKTNDTRARRRTEAEVQTDLLSQLAHAKAAASAAAQRADILASQLAQATLASADSAKEAEELRKALAKATEARPATPVEHTIETPVKMPSSTPPSSGAGADAYFGDGGDGSGEVALEFPEGKEAAVPAPAAEKASDAQAGEPVALPPPLPSKSKRKASFALRAVADDDLSYPVADDYDFTKTTTDNYGIPYKESSTFHGKYPHIRELSDYSWHSNYSKERQLWHDKVVDSVVVKTQPQATPWIVYTCGPMGAGKGYALQWMSDNGFFPLDNIVHIDPDHFKSVMPEWGGYTAADTSSAGSQCHQESGYIQELAQEVAMDKSQNIWVDGSLRNGKWFETVYDDIRERFPRYRIAIFYVYASEKTIRARVKSREEKTGRGVPEQELVDSMEAPDKSLGMLVSKVDFIARIDNNYAVPRLAAFETVDASGSWNALKSKFAYTQAHPSEFPASLAPIWLHKFVPGHASFAWDDTLLARITTLGNKEASIVKFSAQTYAENDSMAKLSSFLPDPSIRVSPIFPVNLDSESRGAAGIPTDAQSFLYCYGIDLQDQGPGHISESKRRWSMLKPRWPSHDMIRLCTLAGTKKLGIDLHDPFVALVIHGGYMYFDVNNQVCGATSILAAPESPNDSLLQFSDGDCIDMDGSSHLIKKLDSRFAAITIPFMLAKGAVRYAWMLPGESFGSNIQNKYGGFLYEFDHKAEFRCRFFPILGAVEEH